MGFLSLLALATVVVPVGPVGDAGADFQDLLVNDKSTTIVSLEVPWDGSDIEVNALAKEPPKPKVEPAATATAATSGDEVPASRSAAAEGTVITSTSSESTVDMLTRIAGQGGPVMGQTNGSMPSDLLCAIPWAPSFEVYCPTLEPLVALNNEYRQAFGTDLSFASAFRPGFQGRSFHGWGIAIDLNGPNGLLGFGDPQFQWLSQHAPAYGWYLPFWAGSGGSNPEPWHWEFGSYYHGTSADYASAAPPVVIHWIKH